ncbi:MAG: OmpA family protein [Cytophagaceae bacterium]
MTGKVLQILIICLVTTIASFAQKKKTLEEIALGHRYYEKGDYFMARKLYQSAIEEVPEDKLLIHRIAECYRNHLDYKNAEKWYHKSINLSSEYPMDKFWYAVMLKKNGKYEEAQKKFGQFISDFKADSEEDKLLLARANLELQGCELAITESKKPIRNYRFEPLPFPVNSPASDYATVIYKNDSSLIITSSRKGATGKDVYNKLGDSFSDNFQIHKTDKIWDYVDDKENFSVVNTPKNDGAGVFSSDRKKFYFTRCDEPNGGCSIYFTKISNGKWQNPVKLNENINMPGEWNAQPALTAKNDTMFFVSKRPGGKGMHDIWYSVLKGENENWGPAVNLSSVNTPYIDISPTYYPEENILFYSSDGKEGFGGLDIFKAQGKNYEEVTNIGLPFNSSRDDFYFVLGKEKGYLSSNREGGLGNDDIYMFYIESQEALIAIIYKDSIPEDALSVSVKGQILDEQTKKGVADVDIFLDDANKNRLKATTTNEKGEFRFENLPKENYRVTIEDKNPKLTAEVKYVVEDIKVKSSNKVASKDLFENIYFDFDEFDLRPEALKTLDDLVSYYKKNPGIQIEMNANTDNYGTAKYNEELSEKRGKAALDYLKSKGVDKSALVVNARGAENPITTNDNPVGRQLNRRVEFSIIGGSGYESKTMIYIIEPHLTLYSIARKFGMSVEELKQLNGLPSEKIIAFRPLRVKRPEGVGIIAPVTFEQSTSKEFDQFKTLELEEKKYKRNR